MIKLGVSPIAWSNDDMPELGVETTLEECLSEAKIAGFSGIEFGGKFPLESEILIPKLKKENLKLCSGWYGAHLLKNKPTEEYQLMKQQLRLFQDCQATCMVVAEVTNSIQGDPMKPLSKRPILDNDAWKTLVYRINELSSMMIDSGMPLAYHHHMGTVIQTQKEIERLIENTKDSVKLLIDTGHMLFTGGDSIKLINDFYQKIIHVHTKDIRKDVLLNSLREDLSFRQAFLNGTFTVPGDGCIDFSPIITALKDKHYSGWIVIEAEQDPIKANPLEYAKKGYNYLSKVIKDTGLKILD